MLAEVVVKSFLLSRAENIFTYKIPKNIEEEIKKIIESLTTKSGKYTPYAFEQGVL